VTLDVFAKRAWTNACARAGIDDLHFHDLRHEAGSRLLEAGWPIHHVKEMLGHANLSYLNAGRMGLQDSMQRFDPLPLQSCCNRLEAGATA
jgi:integrase